MELLFQVGDFCVTNLSQHDIEIEHRILNKHSGLLLHSKCEIDIEIFNNIKVSVYPTINLPTAVVNTELNELGLCTYHIIIT